MSKTNVSSLTKDELSIKLCDLLNVQVDFSKMSKEDLVKLYDALSKLFRPLSEMSLGELFGEFLGDRDKPAGSRMLPRVRKRIREFMDERSKE